MLVCQRTVPDEPTPDHPHDTARARCFNYASVATAAPPGPTKWSTKSACGINRRSDVHAITSKYLATDAYYSSSYCEFVPLFARNGVLRLSETSRTYNSLWTCRWLRGPLAVALNVLSSDTSLLFVAVVLITLQSASRASLIVVDEISRSWRDHAGDLCRPRNDPRPVPSRTAPPSKLGIRAFKRLICQNTVKDLE